MKYLNTLSFVTLLLFAFTACGSSSSTDEPDAVKTVVECTPQTLTFTAEKSVRGLQVDCNSEWTVYSNEAWLKCEKTLSDPSLGNGVTGNAFVTAEANPAEQQRSGSVIVKSGTTRLSIAVTQEAKPAEPEAPAEEEEQNIVAPEGYELVWHDEFADANGVTSSNRLNSNDWTHEVQNAGWVNSELQNYVNGSALGQRVTELVDGKLRINCFKGSDDKIYSGRVYAHINEGWQYGYIEARICLPKGKGTWPAFWMMPVGNDFGQNPWPRCGEIDIMEEVGCVPNEVSSSLHSEGHNHTNNTQITKAITINQAEGDYHVYALEWTKERIVTYVDGKELLRYESDGTVANYPYDKPFYIILNLAWGGSWGGMHGVDASALPVTMKVDYVRVFQKK